MESNTIFNFIQQGFRTAVGATASVVETLQDDEVADAWHRKQVLAAPAERGAPSKARRRSAVMYDASQGEPKARMVTRLNVQEVLGAETLRGLSCPFADGIRRALIETLGRR
jgi:hypothetical protein